MKSTAHVALLAAAVLSWWIAPASRVAHARFGQRQYVLSHDERYSGAGFGSSVDIRGDTVIVGADEEWVDGFREESGAAYVFDLTSGGAPLRLVSPRPLAKSRFGEHVALGEGFAVVSSRERGGSVNRFDRITGEHVAVFEPRVGPSRGLSPGLAAMDDFFAVSLPTASRSGFGPPSAYAHPGDGEAIGPLIAPDGTPDDWFGQQGAIATNGSLIAVGSMLAQHDEEMTGAVYVFDPTTDAPPKKITPGPEVDEGDLFGQSVDMDGSRLLVGASFVDGATFSTGAAYLYDAHTATRLATFFAEDGELLDGFGETVAIDDGVALVGAPWRDTPAVYVYDLASRRLLTTYTGPPGAPRSGFGQRLALDDGVAVASYRELRPDGERVGLVDVFDVSLETTRGNFSGDREVSNTDLNLLLNNWGKPATPTGWNGRAVQGDSVDNSELNELLYYWGVGVWPDGGGGVPEPAAGLLLAVGAVGGLTRRRRR